MSASKILKPCPFCGSARVDGCFVRDGWRIGCLDCGAGVCAFHPQAHTRSAEKWNRRNSPPLVVVATLRAAIAATSEGREQSSNTRENDVEIAHIAYERTENSIETTDQHVVDTRTDPNIGGQKQTEVGNASSPTTDATKAHRSVGDEPLGQYRNNRPDDQPSAGLNVPPFAREGGE